MGDYISGSVQTCTFWKEGAGNFLLLATSCHPTHTIRLIPVGEFIRARHNCSSADSFKKECDIITSRLKGRGYQDWHIYRGIAIASNRSRNTLINKSTANKHQHKHSGNILVTFVTLFSQEYSQIKGIISKYLPVLNADEALLPVLSNGCRFSSRRAGTVENISVIKS